MLSRLNRFETIANALAQLPKAESIAEPTTDTALLHAFDSRNVHPGLPGKVRRLFDDGHFAEATFHAFKYLDKQVQKHSGMSESGFKLMMGAFDESCPKLKLTSLKTESEKDEQKGFRFLFAGGVSAIRNPRGHEYTVVDGPDTCLDHLTFISMLLRRLEASGFK